MMEVSLLITVDFVRSLRSLTVCSPRFKLPSPWSMGLLCLDRQALSKKGATLGMTCDHRVEALRSKVLGLEFRVSGFCSADSGLGAFSLL